MRTAVAAHPIGKTWYYRPVIKSFGIKPARIAGLLGSVTLHAYLLFLGGAVLIKPIEFAVDRGQSGMDVKLVTGSQEPLKTSAEISPSVQIVEPVVEKTVGAQSVTEMLEVQKEIPQDAAQEIVSVSPAKQFPTIEPNKIENTVSSKPTVKGNSTVNASSIGQGAQMSARPDYLTNPAPRYPFEARRNGWEGTVLIRAFVDKEGYPGRLEVEKSSGHLILDESALKAVKKWRFNPALIGRVPVGSTVYLPVRFDLNDV